MIKKLSVLLLLITISLNDTYALPADAILGKWINPSGEGQIQIYKKGHLFFGKLVWLKTPNDPATGTPSIDKLNPDKSRQLQPILGLELLKDFTFDGNDMYTGGTIYDPQNGKTYSCKMTINGNKLKIRGYIGISLLGRSETWTRIK